MEILKKLIATSFITILFLSFQARGQENVIAAFKDSYAFEKDGEYAKAIEKIKSVYEVDSYEANLRLGWLNYLSGQFYESIGFYSKAISIYPYAIEARFGMAYPAYALGKIDDVMTQYLKIIEIDPQNTLANYRLGLIYYGKGNYEKAEACFEKVVNLYPFDYDSLLMFAWTKLKLQKFREAKVLFNKVLIYNPGDASATEGLQYVK